MKLPVQFSQLPYRLPLDPNKLATSFYGLPQDEVTLNSLQSAKKQLEAILREQLWDLDRFINDPEQDISTLEIYNLMSLLNSIKLICTMSGICKDYIEAHKSRYK